MTFEVDLDTAWGFPDGMTAPVMLKFEYKSADSTGTGGTYIGFTGNLWVQVTDAMVALDRLTSDCPLVPRLTPIPDTPQYYIDLLALAKLDKGSVAQLQGLLPTFITALSFEISNEAVAFSGTMVADPLADTVRVTLSSKFVADF